MIRTGEVVEKAGEMVTVVFERPQACKDCGGCLQKNCTHIALQADAEIGDTLDVEMPDQNILKASALAYIFPLGLLLAGLFAGTALHPSIAPQMNQDLLATLCGGAGLIIGLTLVTAIDKRLRKKQNWQPRIRGVHKKPASDLRYKE